MEKKNKKNWFKEGEKVSISYLQRRLVEGRVVFEDAAIIKLKIGDGKKEWFKIINKKDFLGSKIHAE